MSTPRGGRLPFGAVRSGPLRRKAAQVTYSDGMNSTFASQKSRARPYAERVKRVFSQPLSSTLSQAQARWSPTSRPLARTPSRGRGTLSSQRLNQIATLMCRCSTYLEVGVARGETFEAVQVPFRWGVDPAPRFRRQCLPEGVRFFHGTSDEFFANLPLNIGFDLVFIDGLHEWRQTYRDVANALRLLEPDGVLVIDDCVPDDRFSAIPDMGDCFRQRALHGVTRGTWHGDVYKVVLALLRFDSMIEVRLVGDAHEDNVQAVVRKVASLKEAVPIEPPSDLAAYLDSLTYDDVFPDGAVPAELQSDSGPNPFAWLTEKFGSSVDGARMKD